MKNKFVKFFMSILVFSFGISSYANDSERTGFLNNVKELKEVSDVMDIIIERFSGEKEIEKKTIIQGALKGMIESLDDPHSNYFNKKEYEDFREDIKGKFEGVGMVVQKKVNEAMLVVSPIEDGPAYKAGIKPKDKIVAIDGESIYPLTNEESVKKLRGKKDTEVTITIHREATDQRKDFTLIREVITLKYVKHKMLEDNIGYLRLTQFGENVHLDLEKSIEDLQKSGMKGLIFDLRNNPGGDLVQAIKVSSLFIKSGTIVKVKEKSSPSYSHNREGKYYGDFPLVILINGGSASASEIVAGAVKDHKRGILVGEKSFGKASVQSLMTLSEGDGLKITIAKYFTPNDVLIHGIGIEPDVPVEDKEYYLISEGVVTNIDEEATKENKKDKIKDIVGEEEVKKVDEHQDIQLDVGKGILKGLLMQRKSK